MHSCWEELAVWGGGERIFKKKEIQVLGRLARSYHRQDGVDRALIRDDSLSLDQQWGKCLDHGKRAPDVDVVLTCSLFASATSTSSSGAQKYSHPGIVDQDVEGPARALRNRVLAPRKWSLGRQRLARGSPHCPSPRGRRPWTDGVKGKSFWTLQDRKTR